MIHPSFLGCFRYISRAPLKNPDVANLQQASASATASGAEKSSRSSRMMRPSVQGLVIEEEDEELGGRRGSAANSTFGGGAYFERGKRRKSSTEYAQYDNFLNGEETRVPFTPHLPIAFDASLH